MAFGRPETLYKAMRRAGFLVLAVLTAVATVGFAPAAYAGYDDYPTTTYDVSRGAKITIPGDYCPDGADPDRCDRVEIDVTRTDTYYLWQDKWFVAREPYDDGSGTYGFPRRDIVGVWNGHAWVFNWTPPTAANAQRARGVLLENGTVGAPWTMLGLVSSGDYVEATTAADSALRFGFSIDSSGYIPASGCCFGTRWNPADTYWLPTQAATRSADAPSDVGTFPYRRTRYMRQRFPGTWTWRCVGTSPGPPAGFCTSAHLEYDGASGPTPMIAAPPDPVLRDGPGGQYGTLFCSVLTNPDPGEMRPDRVDPGWVVNRCKQYGPPIWLWAQYNNPAAYGALLVEWINAYDTPGVLVACAPASDGSPGSSGPYCAYSPPSAGSLLASWVPVRRTGMPMHYASFAGRYITFRNRPDEIAGEPGGANPRAYATVRWAQGRPTAQLGGRQSAAPWPLLPAEESVTGVYLPSTYGDSVKSTLSAPENPVYDPALGIRGLRAVSEDPDRTLVGVPIDPRRVRKVSRYQLTAVRLGKPDAGACWLTTPDGEPVSVAIDGASPLEVSVTHDGDGRHLSLKVGGQELTLDLAPLDSGACAPTPLWPS